MARPWTSGTFWTGSGMTSALCEGEGRVMPPCSARGRGAMIALTATSPSWSRSRLSFRWTSFNMSASRTPSISRFACAWTCPFSLPRSRMSDRPPSAKRFVPSESLRGALQNIRDHVLPAREFVAGLDYAPSPSCGVTFTRRRAPSKSSPRPASGRRMKCGPGIRTCRGAADAATGRSRRRLNFWFWPGAERRFASAKVAARRWWSLVR